MEVVAFLFKLLVAFTVRATCGVPITELTAVLLFLSSLMDISISIGVPLLATAELTAVVGLVDVAGVSVIVDIGFGAGVAEVTIEGEEAEDVSGGNMRLSVGITDGICLAFFAAFDLPEYLTCLTGALKSNGELAFVESS